MAAMNLVKKLLIAHGDQKARRRLVLFLAAAGYDLRAFATADAALESARNEWFDLALVDYELSGAREFSCIEALKKIQPTVPIILCVQKLELPVIVKGIRVGVTDVLARDNLSSVVRRAATLLNPDVPEPAEHDIVTADEMAEVEAMLDRIAGRGGATTRTIAVRGGATIRTIAGRGGAATAGSGNAATRPTLASAHATDAGAAAAATTAAARCAGPAGGIARARTIRELAVFRGRVERRRFNSWTIRRG